MKHLAHQDAWEPIRRHGLLCTSSLRDLWEVKGKQRSAVERAVRKDEVELWHPRRGTIFIRDQKPLYERKLRKALIDCTVEEWCLLLNRRVFFWPTVERLITHISGRHNRAKKHLVLTLDSYRLAAAYEKDDYFVPVEFGKHDSVRAAARDGVVDAHERVSLSGEVGARRLLQRGGTRGGDGSSGHSRFFGVGGLHDFFGKRHQADFTNLSMRFRRCDGSAGEISCESKARQNNSSLNLRARSGYQARAGFISVEWRERWR